MKNLTPTDMALLSQARTFDLVTHDPPGKCGVVLSVGTVSEREQLDAAQRLVAAGWLEPSGKPSQDKIGRIKRISQRYVVTDAGRAAVRAHEGTPELTLDAARAAHAADLRTIYGDLPLARRQLELRRRGTGIVRAALGALGHVYTGTGGWHVTAYATPESRLGLIDIARGVAVTTSVELEPELVEALTAPSQPEGVLASGATAWTAPDAGEGRRAGAPPGWRQLLVDVRASADGGENVTLDGIAARVTTWGLATCYESKPGAPGWTGLDGFGEQRLRIEEWPVASPEVRQQMRAIGARWLDATARRLAELAGCAESVCAALDRERADEPLYASAGPGAPLLPRVDIGAASNATGAYAWHPHGYDAQSCARTCCNSTTDVMRIALRDARVGRISAACDVSNVGGLRYYDLITKLLECATTQRLTPVAEALWTQLAPLVPSREDGRDLYMRIQPILRGLAAEIATDLLRGVAESASAAEDEIVAAYYAQGPVSVDIPIQPKQAAAA